MLLAKYFIYYMATGVKLLYVMLMNISEYMSEDERMRGLVLL